MLLRISRSTVVRDGPGSKWPPVHKVLGKKVYVKLDFKLGKELKKVQKQGRDERTQEDYPTSAKIHTRCRVVFLRSFISALFLYFFQLLP